MRIPILDYLRFFSDYTVIDLEATGLNLKRDKIIEIGAATVQDGMIRYHADQLKPVSLGPNQKLLNLKEWFCIRSAHAHQGLDDVLAPTREYKRD